MALPDDVREAWWAWHGLNEYVEPTSWGALVTDARYPDVWDANFARVEAPASLAEVEGALERARSWTGSRHAEIFVPDRDAVGPALGYQAVAVGYEHNVDVVMTLRGDPSPLPERLLSIDIVEIDHGDDDLAATHREVYPLLGPTLAPEVIDQLMERDARLADEAGVRWFAALVEGDVAGFCSTYVAPNRVSVVDNVVTREEHRGLGVATAVVTRAILEARASGSGLTFLVTAAVGGAAPLYQRIGFETVHETDDYVKPPAPT